MRRSSTGAHHRRAACQTGGGRSSQIGSHDLGGPAVERERRHHHRLCRTGTRSGSVVRFCCLQQRQPGSGRRSLPAPIPLVDGGVASRASASPRSAVGEGRRAPARAAVFERGHRSTLLFRTASGRRDGLHQPISGSLALTRPVVNAAVSIADLTRRRASSNPSDTGARPMSDHRPDRSAEVVPGHRQRGCCAATCRR